LYLPKEWLEDQQRCKVAGIPNKTAFATKPELARQMIQKAIEEKVPFKWVSGDSIYGGDRKLRRWLEEQEIAFILAVPKDEPLWYKGFKQWPASEIARQVERLAALIGRRRGQRTANLRLGSSAPWALAGGRGSTLRPLLVAQA
jgi:SRSO17 transposase